MISDISLLGIAQNPSTEEIYPGSGIYGPKVRGIEETDPVYFQIEDSPLVDLRARDVQIAGALAASVGGYYHQYLSELRNDTTNRFSYGTINNRVTTSDFASVGTPIGYMQVTFGPQVKKTLNLYIKLHYAMETSSPGCVVKLACVADLIEIGDDIAVPTVSPSWTPTISVPGTARVLSEEILTIIPLNQLDKLSDPNGVHLAFSIQRLNSGFGPGETNHSGDFKLLGISVYQSV